MLQKRHQRRLIPLAFIALMLENELQYHGLAERCKSARPLLFASVFDNGLADRKSAFKWLNSSILATSCTNLVNVRPIFLEFTLLKRAIFAAISPQFDDDLYSSPWHSETDWKIAILISAE